MALIGKMAGSARNSGISTGELQGGEELVGAVSSHRACQYTTLCTSAMWRDESLGLPASWDGQRWCSSPSRDSGICTGELVGAVSSHRTSRCRDESPGLAVLSTAIGNVSGLPCAHWQGGEMSAWPITQLVRPVMGLLSQAVGSAPDSEARTIYIHRECQYPTPCPLGRWRGSAQDSDPMLDEHTLTGNDRDAIGIIIIGVKPVANPTIRGAVTHCIHL
ncbi:hypothetical protein BU15DRAFT_68459 [Melanogaster broomeanus]|nr:hypothetical protein BU15DRAFT_68459 [Melanogaster broomeanus]